MRSLTVFAVLYLFNLPSVAQAHCQIPCGIYDDARVFSELEQHVDTIARSLEGLAESKTMHDAARWTMNKEQHAQAVQDTAQAYFLAQRVKPVEKGRKGYKDYVTSTTLLHQIIVAAMKTKQSDNIETSDALKDVIGRYKAHYWSMHGHPHNEEK